MAPSFLFFIDQNMVTLGKDIQTLRNKQKVSSMVMLAMLTLLTANIRTYIWEKGKLCISSVFYNDQLFFYSYSSFTDIVCLLLI